MQAAASAGVASRIIMFCIVCSLCRLLVPYMRSSLIQHIQFYFIIR
nr:MAG TPA: hypothetical protein [Caudoviricetes sp.]